MKRVGVTRDWVISATAITILFTTFATKSEVSEIKLSIHRLEVQVAKLNEQYAKRSRHQERHHKVPPHPEVLHLEQPKHIASQEKASSQDRGFRHLGDP